MADISGYEPADAIGKNGREDVFCCAAHPSAVGARIQNRWRPVYAAAERELIVHRIGGFGINFPEAQIVFDDVAVDWESARHGIGIRRTVAGNCRVEAR